MDLFSLLIGAIIASMVGFPFTIFGNLVTSPIQDYLKNRSITRQQRKINRIVDEYQIAESLSKGFQARVTYLLLYIAAGVFCTLFFLVITGILVLAPGNTLASSLSPKIQEFLKIIQALDSLVLSVVPFLYGYAGYIIIRTFYRFLVIFFSSLDIDETKEKAKQKLIKLGINPRSVNKELNKELPEEE